MSNFDENRAEAAREIPELKIESKTETLHLPKENLSLHLKPKMSKKLLFNPIFVSSIDHKKILQRQNEISQKKELKPREENQDLELENCIEPDSLDTQPNLLKFLKHFKHLTYVYFIFSVIFFIMLSILLLKTFQRARFLAIRFHPENLVIESIMMRLLIRTTFFQTLQIWLSTSIMKIKTKKSFLYEILVNIYTSQLTPLF